MRVCVSVVSHGHGAEAGQLLTLLARGKGDTPVRRVILTLNVPEPGLPQALHARAPWPFDLHIVENAAAKGFGANHNHAFALDARLGASEGFAVVNPDISWQHDPFAALLHTLLEGDERVGVVYPVQTDAAGCRQDHERLLPTPARLVRRYLWPGARRELHSQQQPDWVNAAFLLLRRDVYASVGGFDEAYHMYCEDVDLCLRLQLAGWQLRRADDVTVVHKAHRASRRDPRHLLWHVQSLLRLWRSRAYAVRGRQQAP